MTAALIVVWSIVCYLWFVGAAYVWADRYLDDRNLVPWTAFVALFWPISAPIALGMYTVRAPARWEKASREEARKMMEAAEAAKRRTAELEKDCEIGDPAPEPQRALRSERRGYVSNYGRWIED